MGIIINLLINGVAVFVTSYVLSAGVKVDSFVTAIIVAVVLGLVNTFIKPIIHVFALPLTVITLGLFSLVINALMILLVDALISGFEVNGFIWALIFSFVLSLVNSVLGRFTK
jgi:putative membrane protein